MDLLAGKSKHPKGVLPCLGSQLPLAGNKSSWSDKVASRIQASEKKPTQKHIENRSVIKTFSSLNVTTRDFMYLRPSGSSEINYLFSLV